MIKNNKYWILLITIMVAWTTIIFSSFGENIYEVDSGNITNILLHNNTILWIVSLLFSIPFLYIIQNQKSRIFQLQENQKNFFVLYDFFPMPAFIVDKSKHQIIKANKVAIKTFRINSKENEPIKIEILDYLINGIKQYKDSKIKNIKIENTYVTSDGKELLFEAILHDIYLDNSLVTLILLNDQTESNKELEEMTNYIDDLHAKEDALEENAFELIQLNIKLEESENNLREVNANKDKFFSIVAHDLKSPFIGLLGITEMLDTDYDEFEEKEKRELIHSLYDISKNTFELLEGLLEWARAKQGRMDYNPKEFNLFQLTDSLMNLLRANAFKKEITLKNYVDMNTIVLGDREMVSTILRNLLANAIKFTPQNGVIQIKSEIENNLMKVSVRDSGIGISPENIEKLFRIDVNHTTSGTNNEKGTGLGLILCQELIERHGTNIWVESELGKGSMFVFTLPLAKNS